MLIMTAFRRNRWMAAGCCVLFAGLMETGCVGQLTEVRSKWKMGPEFRSTDSATHKDRWTAQTGLEAKFSDGKSIGLTFRRRDNSNSDGFSEHDNGMWFEFSFPLWKAEKKNPLAVRVAQLEERLAHLEGETKQ